MMTGLDVWPIVTLCATRTEAGQTYLRTFFGLSVHLVGGDLFSLHLHCSLVCFFVLVFHVFQIRVVHGEPGKAVVDDEVLSIVDVVGSVVGPVVMLATYSCHLFQPRSQPLFRIEVNLYLVVSSHLSLLILFCS